MDGLIKHRLSDIVPTASPIVNIGKLMHMRQSKERTEFGARLYAARIAAKKTQMHVRKALGISQSNLSELEWKAESSGFTAQLAALYHCDPHYLATGEGSARQSALPPPEGASAVSAALKVLGEALESMAEMDRDAVGQYLASLAKSPKNADVIGERVVAIIEANDRSRKRRAGGN